MSPNGLTHSMRGGTGEFAINQGRLADLKIRFCEVHLKSASDRAGHGGNDDIQFP